MAVNLSPLGGAGAQFFTNDGVPLTGGLLYTYLAGTSTPATTYTSGNGLTALANPIILDAAGRVPTGEIWLTDGIAYKFVLKDSTDVLIATWDGLSGINSNFIAYTAQEETVTATAGQTVFDLSIAYIPGANNLAVFVNGSNQIVSVNYTETDADTVTFLTGLNVGDVVKFSTATPVATNATDAANVSYTPAGAAAVTTNVQAKLRQYVSVKDFGAVGNGTTDDTVAIQAALDSGATKVTIGSNCAVTTTLTLSANQIVDFAGGTLTALVSFSGANGILFGDTQDNIKIYDANIDASATSGVTGINLVDCPNSTIKDANLIKCNIQLSATSALTPMNYVVKNAVINGDGWQQSLFYTSSVYKASISDVIVYDGLEGFAIYNGCSHIKYTRCESYGHTRDGFVIINGVEIAYAECYGYDNTQSGFTTQRLTAGTDVRNVTYNGCQAFNNTADGFDLRGATTTSFGVNINITCNGCIANSNAAAGFYVVLAEGVSLTGCSASGNSLVGFHVNDSDKTIITGCRSASNASGVSAGTPTFKVGILIQDSDYCGVVACSSDNSSGATQTYGLSIVGSSAYNYVTGGNYINNSINTIYQDSGGSAYILGANNQSVGGVYPNTKSGITGISTESGVGVPSHTRPKSSLFMRSDAGGNGEVYVSNGSGTWYLLT
jgi:hypothetical protein